NAGFLIEPRERKLPARDRPPVAHHVALVAPGSLEDRLQELSVAAGVLAVDLVVARHDRAGLGALDGDLEREQVRLAGRRRIDDRIQPVSVRLVAVQAIMLERRDDALALNSVDGLRAQHGAVERILRVVLEVSAVARIPGEVDPAGELHVEAALARLAR